ncbi:MAG: sulfur carrier protein ThiS [Anaerolineae bacterium]
MMKTYAEIAGEIHLIVAGLLKNYLAGPPPEPRPGQTVQALIEELGLPAEMVAFVLVNGRLRPKSYVLKEGDVVKLAPLVGGGKMLACE